MNNLRLDSRAVVSRPKRYFLTAAVLSAVLCEPALADGLRPAVAAPLQAAEHALAAKKFSLALKQVAKAEAVPGKTAQETLTVEQVRAAVDVGRHDDAAAAADYAQIIAGGGLPPDQVQLMAEGEASLDYQAGNYGGAISTIKAYLPGNPQFEPILLQSYYKQNDCGDVEATVDRLAKPPREADLQMVASCDNATKNNAGYQRAIASLVMYYPTPAYWTTLLNAELSNPEFSDQLALDFFRLKLAANVPAAEPEYMDMTQAAVQAGLLNEAATIMAQGYAAGVLGNGPDADRQTRLKALVLKRQAAAAVNVPQQIATAANAGDELAVFGIGFNQVDGGDAAGIKVMADAIRSGKLSRPGQAELELGIAYREAKQTASARAMWRAVQGGGAPAELGRLWLYLR